MRNALTAAGRRLLQVTGAAAGRANFRNRAAASRANASTSGS